MRPGDTRAQNCADCRLPFHVHMNGLGMPFTRVIGNFPSISTHIQSIGNQLVKELNLNTVLCPNCNVPHSLESSMKPGETRALICSHCGQAFNAHANYSGTAFTRPIPEHDLPLDPLKPLPLVELEPLCYYCQQQFKVQMPGRPGSTAPAICGNCGKQVNVHVDGHKRVFTRPAISDSFDSPANRPNITHVEFLRATDYWIDVGERQFLVKLAGDVAASMSAKSLNSTPAGLAEAISSAAMFSGLFVRKKTVNCFVKILLNGGAFKFKENLANGWFRSEFINALQQEDIVAALCRGYLRRLRSKFDILLSDFDTLAFEINADSLPGGRDALASVLRESPGIIQNAENNSPIDSTPS